MFRVFKNISNVMKADKLMRPSGRPGTGSRSIALCPLHLGEGCRRQDGVGTPRRTERNAVPLMEGGIGGGDIAILSLETSGDSSGGTWLGRRGPKGSRGDA